MQYMGSKYRITKKLLEVMLPYRKPGQYWVEPFVGAGGMIQNVDGPRIGADTDECIVSFLLSVRDGWVPSPVTEEQYYLVKEYKEFYSPEYLAYVGYGCSFGGKWFRGFAKNSAGTDYSKIAINSIKKQAPKLKGSMFFNCSYNELDIPKNSIIYCDPPYQRTTRYNRAEFDHAEFWQWCRDMSGEGHLVFVSEYTAPEDFECIFELEHTTALDKNQKKKRIEKLFAVR